MIVSRNDLIDSRYASVVCAPIYSQRSGLETEVSIGVPEGLLHESTVRCDELTSVRKAALSTFIGELSLAKVRELDTALSIALSLDTAGNRRQQG